MLYLKQSVAVDIKVGPFVDSTDGVTAETGLTITQPDVRLSKNAGGFAQKSASQTLSHNENGWYTVNLSTTDTDTVGHLIVAINESGALPVWCEFTVLEEAIYDALFAASATGLLPSNVTQFGGSNGTFSSGRPEVNTTHAAGTAWASGAITAASIASNAITDAKIASGALTAAKFAAGAFDAVWTVSARTLTAATNLPSASDIATAVWAAGTRLLTAGTNIALAKGTGVTGFNDLSAAQVNAEVDTALADYDPPTRTEATADKDEILNALPSEPPTASENADAVLDEVVDGTRTLRQLARGWTAALLGKVSGIDSHEPKFRNIADGKDVIDAETDADGNRTAVTLDLS